MSGDNLIQPNLRMEKLSIAYIKAVASFCGYGADQPEVDHDSIDLTIKSSAGRKPILDMQVKASGGINSVGDNFSFPLPVKNYNDLRQETLAPRILVVFCMPDEQDKWIDHSVDHLLIRKCAYWVSLKNMPATTNTTTVSINVPTTNTLSPDGLHALMQKIDKGEDV